MVVWAAISLEARLPADPKPRNTPSGHRVAVLSRDLFFGMRIRNALKQMGYVALILKSEAELESALADAETVLALIDFNSNVDWDAIATSLATHPDTPMIAFGAHTDTDGFRQARAAGVTRVISNGAFSQQLPGLVERYARDNA